MVPPFITSVFFSALLFQLGLASWRMGAIVFAHSVIFLPYAIRILTVCFEQVRQDHVDAARDLGASHWARFKVAYLPPLRPGIFATLLIVFIQSIEEFAIAFIVGSPDVVTIPDIALLRTRAGFCPPQRGRSVTHSRRSKRAPDAHSGTASEIRQSDPVFRQGIAAGSITTSNI